MRNIQKKLKKDDDKKNQKLKRYFVPELIRPIVYMSFVRFILALTASLLIAFLVSAPAEFPLRAYAFTAFSVFFLLLAWFAYLRLDGARLPTIDKTLFEWKRRPIRSYGDITDHIDEKVQSFEELEPGEREFARMASNIIAFVIFAILSIL